MKSYDHKTKKPEAVSLEPNSSQISASKVEEKNPMDSNAPIEPAETVVTEKKKTKCSGCLGRTFKFRIITLLILSFFIYWNIFRGKELKISPETTLITEPFFKDSGVLDYFKAIEMNYPPEMKTDDNGARIIVREIGPSIEYPRIGQQGYQNQYWRYSIDRDSIQFKRLYEQLGLDPNIPPRLEYLEHYSAYYDFLDEKYPGDENRELREKKNNRFENFLYQNSFWKKKTDEDFEFAKIWTEIYSPALDVIAEAIHKPVFVFPINHSNSDDQYHIAIECLLPDVQASRNYARSLAFRAQYRIGTGDINGAISDIIATKRLGKQFTKYDGFNVLVMLLVGIAVDGIGTGIPIGENPDAQPTRNDWQRLLDEEVANPIFINMEKCLDSELYWEIDCINAISSTNKLKKIDPEFKNRLNESLFWRDKFVDYLILPIMMKTGIDWNIVAKNNIKYFNQSVKEGNDSIENVYQNLHNDENTAKCLMKLFFRSLTLKSRSKLVGDWLSCQLLPATDAAKEASNRCYCFNQMQKLNYAMQLYKADHGTFPPAFTVDANGNPLHSWRVLLLPYLGQKELFDQIKLDEPWDSEHNRAFHSADLAIYRCPSLEKAQIIIPGETSYSVIVGKNSLFDESGVGKDPLAMIKENPEKDALDMFLIIERSDPICWMRPDNEIRENNVRDYGINQRLSALNPRVYKTNEVRYNDRIPGIIASVHPGGANFALSNGAGLFLAETLTFEDDPLSDERNKITLRHYLFGEQFKLDFEQQFEQQ